MVALSNTFEIWTELFTFFTMLGILVGAVVLSYMGYLILRYRAKATDESDPEDAPKLGELPKEQGRSHKLLISLTLSAIVVISLIVGTFNVMDVIERPPAGSLDIKVIGFQWGWKFIYPNGYVSVGELRVPKDEVIRLWVTSEDVFHNFGIVEFRIKIDAIPGTTNLIWFEAYETGTYKIMCYELCGVGHAFMVGKLIVMEPEEFYAWYSEVKAGES